MATNHTQMPQPHTLAQTICKCHQQTRGYQSHPIPIATHLDIKHIQLPQPHTRALTTYNSHLPNTWAQITSKCHSHTSGHQTHSPATAIHAGANHIQPLPPHAWAPNHTQLPNPTGITKLVGTIHIHLSWTYTWASNTSNCQSHLANHEFQLPQIYRCAPNTSNCHRHTHGRQPYPTVPTIRIHKPHPTSTGKQGDTNHFQLPPPYTWEPTTFICHRHTRRQRTTPNCHGHTRWHRPHPTGITKLVGTNHIKCPWPHTWASNTSNCHSHTRVH